MLFSTAATWSDSAPSRRLFYNNPVRRKRNDTSCSAFRCRDGVRRRSKQKRHRLSVVPLERATRISPKRRLRRIQRGEIEEAAGELPATAGKATIAATVSADGARKKAPSFDGAFGAGDEARTRYLHLGKVALYQMSYARGTMLTIADLF